MSNYFTPYFPKVNYKLGSDSHLITNITVRFKIREEVKNRKVIYYEYEIRDGDRPDTIAAKYYGDPNLDWVVMIVNDIFDVNYDWPMDSFTFEKFLRSKYGSVANAKSQVQRYEKIIKKGGQDEFGNPKEEKVVIVDKDTFDSTPITNRREISAYEHEDELNESKRNILILDKFYLEQILEEAEDIFE